MGRYAPGVLRQNRIALFGDFYISFKTDAIHTAIAKKPHTSSALNYSNEKRNYSYAIRAIYRDRSKK